jgi:ribonuclease PH
MQRSLSLSGLIRLGNRSYDQIRELSVTYDVFSYAAGSTLFQMGNTKVLCAVTLQSGIPHFLKGKKTGWLTAEYALLPASTPIRTVREVTVNKRSGRTIEISRLIGRSLRAVTHLHVLSQHTIFIDCDVLQADGGTRIACITGAYLALRAAQERWKADGTINQDILYDEVAAISVGAGSYGLILDMDFAEDSTMDVDFNFVLTRSNRILEIQGSAERAPLEWHDYGEMERLARLGTEEIFKFFDKFRYHYVNDKAQHNKQPLYHIPNEI